MRYDFKQFEEVKENKNQEIFNYNVLYTWQKQLQQGFSSIINSNTNTFYIITQEEN